MWHTNKGHPFPAVHRVVRIDSADTQHAALARYAQESMVAANTTATSSPEPAASSAGIAKISLPTIGVGLVLMLIMVLLRARLRRNQNRRSGGSTPRTPMAPDAAPALARLQRALAKASVGATPLELDAVAPVIPFDPAAHEGADAVCAICLDEMESGAKTRKLPCGHIFDAICVEQWVAKANRCPICNSAPVDPDSLASKHTHRASDVMSGFVPRTRRRRERDPNGGFRLDIPRAVAPNQPPTAAPPTTEPESTALPATPSGVALRPHAPPPPTL